jgi:hypothetical protein
MMPCEAAITRVSGLERSLAAREVVPDLEGKEDTMGRRDQWHAME